MIRDIKIRGNTASLTFGTIDVRDLSDGAFPVEVWRVYVGDDATRTEEHKRTALLERTVTRAVRDAGAGWRVGTVQSWIELRTPKSRT